MMIKYYEEKGWEGQQKAEKCGREKSLKEIDQGYTVVLVLWKRYVENHIVIWSWCTFSIHCQCLMFKQLLEIDLGDYIHFNG